MKDNVEMYRNEIHLVDGTDICFSSKTNAAQKYERLFADRKWYHNVLPWNKKWRDSFLVAASGIFIPADKIVYIRSYSESAIGAKKNDWKKWTIK